MADFSAYYRATQAKPLHPIYERLAEYLPTAGLALDLGCGTGVISRFLASKGLKVLAIDNEQEAIDILVSESKYPNISTALADLASYSFPDAQVIVAGFSLFFLKPSDFHGMWHRMTQSLKPGGLFAGQLLGIHDDWASRGYTVLTHSEVCGLLEPFEVLFFEEADRDGKTAMDEPKHWHVFHIIARKI